MSRVCEYKPLVAAENAKAPEEESIKYINCSK